VPWSVIRSIVAVANEPGEAPRLALNIATHAACHLRKSLARMTT
jgi:hypothetical protein